MNKYETRILELEKRVAELERDLALAKPPATIPVPVFYSTPRYPEPWIWYGNKAPIKWDEMMPTVTC